MGCGASSSARPLPPTAANTPLPQRQNETSSSTRFAFFEDQPLGRGGFSTGVFRGQTANTAIKLTGDSVRHEREVRALQVLKDPNFTLRLLDFSSDAQGSPGAAEDGLCYLVTVAGTVSLAVALHKTGRISEAPAICSDILSALAYMHAQGFAHCDIKPANIVKHDLGLQPSSARWKLIDLDSMRPIGSFIEEWETWEFTDMYIPPEVASAILGDAPRLRVDASIDLWQAGATLAEVLGQTPEPLHGQAAAELIESEGSHAFYRSLLLPLQGAGQGLVETGDAASSSGLGGSGSQPDVELVLPPLAEKHALAGREILASLLQYDPSRRSAAHQLLSSHDFLLRGAPPLPYPESKPGEAGSAEGRWYAITGCACDGCGRKALELRFYCEVCDSFDYCLSCFVERKLGRNEHEHAFACSREVSEYRWFEKAEQAAAFAAEADVLQE
jgi:serine/threonine protein kinase